MTLITFQDGKPVLRDGKVGTEQACCCCDNCLTFSGINSTGGTNSSGFCASFADQDEIDINAYIDLVEQTAQSVADNLSNAGWTASVTVSRSLTKTFFECPGFCPDTDQPGQCYEILWSFDIRINATCECCISLPELPYANCGINNDCELFDQPEGRWVNVYPLDELPYPPGGYIPSFLTLGPDCAQWSPLSALYGINGDYGIDIGDGSFGAIWVPVCAGSEWCVNPLP
jgi:hypothetical protein